MSLACQCARFSTLHVAVVIGSLSLYTKLCALIWFLSLVPSSSAHLAYPARLPSTLAKWLYPTRLETRTKESSVCASILTCSFVCGMKVNFGKVSLAPTTDLCLLREV